jgi:integrase
VEPLRDELESLRPRRLRGDELVFATRAGRPWNLNNWRARVWQPAVERAGIAPCTPYDGRHTFASLLIHEGKSMPYVAAAMGSSGQTIHKHYSHMFDEARLDTAKPMVEAIAEARAAVAGMRDVCAPAPVTVLRQPRRRP